MILTKEQIIEMEQACKPLVKWLNDNCNPHTLVTVHCAGAEIYSGSSTVKIEEFFHD